MFAILFIVLTSLFQYSACLTGASRVNRSYMVYIVWDKSTANEYGDIHTLCGGTLITPEHVLSARECLTLHPYRYQSVIAGYNKYVPFAIARNTEEKECLAIAKRKIIEIKWYQDETLSFWTGFEACVATLEKPYNFANEAFVTKCTYKPTKVLVDYNEPVVGADVLLLGWGSSRYQRPDNVQVDMNEDFLHSTSIAVADLSVCNEEFKQAFDKNYKFCLNGPSKLDHEGKFLGDFNRRQMHNDTENDHGGPVVLHINGIEHVIGLITAYAINRNYECVGPTLGTKFFSETQTLVRSFTHPKKDVS